MKKLLILLALIPFVLNAQIPDPLVDLSKYHDANRLWEMTDLNFTNITAGSKFIMQCTNIDASNDVTIRYGSYFLQYLHD